MTVELEPNQKPKELGELSSNGPDAPAEQETPTEEERTLDTIRGSDLPTPSTRPELGDVKYGK